MNNFDKLKVLCGFKHYHVIKSKVVSVLNYIKRVQVPINPASIICSKSEKSGNQKEPRTIITQQHPVSIFASWMYTFTVFSILMVNPICSAIDQNVPVVFFSFIPVVQFISGVMYHSTSHFEDWWNEYPDKNNYGVTYNKLSLAVFSIFAVCCATLVSTVLNGYWYIIVSVIFGIFAVSLSVVEFWFIFYKHLCVVNDFSKRVNKFEDEINDLVKGLSKIKFDLDTSINAFKNELALTTLLGGISIGYGVLCLNDLNCKADFPWGCVVLFCMHQIVLFCIARYLDNRKNEIERISKHPIFIQKYVSRVSTEELSKRYNNDINMIVIEIVEDNASTLDCQLFYSVVSSSWDQFVVLGCGVANGEYIQKGALVVSVIVILENYLKIHY
jgi:hypothetical protein